MWNSILVAACCGLFTSVAFATTPTQLNIALGTSVPADSTGQTLIEKTGPSRASGGEHFIVNFSSPKNISDIKITSYSTGKAGKSLIHSAAGLNGRVSTPLDGLAQFAKMTMGTGQNYQGNVMLPDSTYVEVQPNQVFTQLDIVVEGFTNNDSSILLQISSNDGLAYQEFLLSRTNSDETLGGYVNEANYAKFSPADVASLFSIAKEPPAADLSGKTYSCSGYSKLNPNQLNYKARIYALTKDGSLMSSSDGQGAANIWASTGAGLGMNLDNYNGCGKYVSTTVVRRTGAGNLVAEVVVDLEAYVALCTAAGYDAAGIRDVETNSTFPSSLDPKYVVDAYEFCRPN